MDSLKFDRLAKALSHVDSRRNVLRLLAAMPLAGELAAKFAGPAWAKRRRKPADAEIVGGSPVPQGRYPFMAFIDVTLPDFNVFRCGGSLISSNHVLTAAHCVVDDPAAPNPQVLPLNAFQIFVGEVNANRFRPQDGLALADLFIHPDWAPNSEGTGPFDVAVLELATPVPPGAGVEIPFVGSGDTRFENAGQPLVVAGWGAIFDGGPVSNQLLEVGVDVVSDQQCAADYATTPNFDSAVMICAALPGRDSCGGDSGGPLFVNELIGHVIEYRKKGKKCKKKRRGKKRCKPKYKKVRVPVFDQTQVGIVSFGQGCASPNGPGVYVRISDPEVNDFITDVISG